MAKFDSRYLFGTVATFSAAGIIIVITLAVFGALSLAATLIGILGVVAVGALLALRPATRLASLSARLDALGLNNQAETTDDAGPPSDPGSGALGDLSSALQRLERNWSRERRAMSDGLAAAATLFDALPDPLITLDPQARLIYANAAARALLVDDRAEAELSGRDLSSVLRQPLVLEAVEAVLAGAETRAVEFTLPDRVDQTYEARVEAIANANTSENDASALLLLRDVTARQRSEQSRADFVANVSHELRTPLTSVIGFIETLRGPAKNDPGSSDRFLELMATQSGRMARLVDDLLSLSRIEMNEHERPGGIVDLRKAIGTVVDLLSPQAHERSIAIEPDLEAVSLPVEGDHDELIQLFQNLVENAIKYAHENTSVRIVARPGDSGGQVTISVIDQGDGIAPEHLARLTERFYRIDTARSRELGGTGLGLAIVKHIVNRHRGDLQISSTEGEGSAFAVTLPYAEQAPADDVAPIVKPAQRIEQDA